MGRVTQKTIDLEFVPCACCGSNDFVPADSIEWLGTRLSYVLCAACGLKYMRPRPTQAWYRRFYAEAFWNEKVTGSGWSRNPAKQRPILPEQDIKKQAARARFVVEAILALTEPTTSTRVLDVGAAFGSVANLLRAKTGCTVLGIEPSELARQYASASGGVPIVGHYAEELLEPTVYDCTIDLLLFSTVLENLNDPLTILMGMKRVLTLQGQVLIITPHLAHYNAINPYHPYVFTPETLALLLDRAGYSVVKTHSGDSKWHRRHFAMLAAPSEGERRIVGKLNVA